MSVLRAHFTQDEVRTREELIVKYIVSLIRDTQQNPGIIPYFFGYGIIDWAWPLRFVKNNEPCKGFKYYSHDAYHAVLDGQKKFRRDHVFPKKQLKQMLFDIETPDPAKVRDCMEKYGEICVITIKEDTKLRDADLSNKMPHGWTIGEDTFARYQNVGINYRINDQQW